MCPTAGHPEGICRRVRWPAKGRVASRRTTARPDQKCASGPHRRFFRKGSRSIPPFAAAFRLASDGGIPRPAKPVMWGADRDFARRRRRLVRARRLNLRKHGAPAAPAAACRGILAPSHCDVVVRRPRLCGQGNCAWRTPPLPHRDGPALHLLSGSRPPGRAAPRRVVTLSDNKSET
jgi:hypothetical protein